MASICAVCGETNKNVWFYCLCTCLLISDDTSSSAVNVPILDFERSVLLHLPKFKPKQVIVHHCTVMIVKLSLILSYSHSKKILLPL